MGLGICDREGLTPLDLVIKDRLPHVNFHHSGNRMYYYVYYAVTTSGAFMKHVNLSRSHSKNKKVNIILRQVVADLHATLSRVACESANTEQFISETSAF